jgi:hypothetical protein
LNIAWNRILRPAKEADVHARIVTKYWQAKWFRMGETDKAVVRSTKAVCFDPNDALSVDLLRSAR